jgi:hypothetical protein
MVLKEGGQMGSLTVEKIEPRKVILIIGDQRHEVELGKEEGGEGQ